ncbi:hypothetical protein O9G_003589 [Rozella allomycis CSF55]|uniref:Uncharacterized protein n=1 Tax=Rozella allomycis (strain CSF55) TaxID=988480 RepID=A0A075AT25_ROZAC|nr:hypothetical protein O9G_003589 [Rozella allomycis CSF55]|eukprot:EPZ31880.1 hypothetical protein O9G_003589 [Rozella allomycis CSF55]
MYVRLVADVLLAHPGILHSDLPSKTSYFLTDFELNDIIENIREIVNVPHKITLFSSDTTPIVSYYAKPEIIFKQL